MYNYYVSYKQYEQKCLFIHGLVLVQVYFKDRCLQVKRTAEICVRSWCWQILPNHFLFRLTSLPLKWHLWWSCTFLLWENSQALFKMIYEHPERCLSPPFCINLPSWPVKHSFTVFPLQGLSWYSYFQHPPSYDSFVPQQWPTWWEIPIGTIVLLVFISW